MPDFGLVRSFDIDDGQLDGLRPQEIFVLGYELAQIDAAIKSTEGCKMLVHAENMSRIAGECKNKRRRYLLTWMSDDASETWMQFELWPLESRDA